MGGGRHDRRHLPLHRGALTVDCIVAAVGQLARQVVQRASGDGAMPREPEGSDRTGGNPAATVAIDYTIVSKKRIDHSIIAAMKQLLSIVATTLTFLAYIPYYRDILRGKTHPHVYSWGLWGLLTVLIVALQIAGGAGPAIWVTVAAGLLCIGVVVLSLKRGNKDITTSDTITAILSLVAIGFWLIANQPVLSIVLVVIADLLAFVPTVRKSWNKPYSETLSLYITNTLRFSLAILAVENYTILSTLWIAAWAAANAVFSIILIVRRRQVPSRGQ